MLEMILSLALEKGAVRRHRFYRAGVFAASSLVACLSAAPSFAQDDGSPEALIKQGVALRRMGEESKAYGYFRRAYETAPTPRSGAQFGLSSVAVGKFAEGEWLLTEALASGDPWTAEHRADLDRGRTTARGKLGTVIWEGVPPGATIAIDGRILGRLAGDRTVRWTPGPTHVRFEAPGHEPFEGEVKFPAARHELWFKVSMPSAVNRTATAPAAMPLIVPVTVPGMAPTTPATSSAPVGEADSPLADSSQRPTEGRSGARDTGGDTATTSGWRRPVLWGALGLGAASVAFGAFETMQYRSSVSDFNKPTRMPLCREGGGMIVGGGECERLVSEGDRAKTLSVVGYAVGGALLTASLILVLTEPPPAAAAAMVRGAGGRAWPGDRGGRSSDGVMMACAPWLGSGGGASCSVRF